MRRHRRLLLCAFVAQAACSGSDSDRVAPPPPRPIQAPAVARSLTVDGGEISLVTVKNGDTEVPAKFDKLTGTFQFQDGARQAGLAGVLEIDLSSWSTGLDERDANVKKTFFSVDETPTARFALGGFDGMPADGLAIGEEVDGTAKGKLSLLGLDRDVSAKVKLRRSGDADYHIDSAEPLYLSIESLGLTDRLVELMTKCEHKSIDDNVKLTFSVELGPIATATPDDAPGPTGKSHRAGTGTKSSEHK